MPEELMIEHCSPTMAGLKTANLFACSGEDAGELNASIRDLNRRWTERGVCVIPVKQDAERTLIYMYRPERLAQDLQNRMARAILAERDYPVHDAKRCVAELMRRLRSDESFPHEIGLFLGYPAEDVHGFIVNKAKRAKCVGAWKVYGDETAAQRKFDLYRKCTRVYRDTYKRNRSLDRLVVGDRSQQMTCQGA